MSRNRWRPIASVLASNGHLHDVMRVFQYDGSIIREQQVSPRQFRHCRRECGLVIAQNRVLDERSVILLFDRASWLLAVPSARTRPPRE